MNRTLKIVFVSFALMLITTGCGGSKEEIQTITIGGSCHPKIDRKLGEPIIVVDFIGLTDDTTFYELPKIVSGIVALQSKIIFCKALYLCMRIYNYSLLNHTNIC